MKVSSSPLIANRSSSSRVLDSLAEPDWKNESEVEAGKGQSRMTSFDDDDDDDGPEIIDLQPTLAVQTNKNVSA